MVKHSEDYAIKRKSLQPDLWVWRQATMSSSFTPSSVLYFLAIIYYMDSVCLPIKRDYWRNDIIWSYHPIMHNLAMNCEKFTNLWRHFHLTEIDLEGIQEDEKEEEN
eukprot:13216832-Ditylum_brightwellii.AAC.1